MNDVSCGIKLADLPNLASLSEAQKLESDEMTWLRYQKRPCGLWYLYVFSKHTMDMIKLNSRLSFYLIYKL